MAFTMETSRTADAAKLAVLWRDRDKKQPGVGGGSVPDHFVEDVFEGGILPEVIPPPAGPPTTNPDGTTTPGVVPEPTLVDRKTVYTDAPRSDLKSLYEAVRDIRLYLDPVAESRDTLALNPSARASGVPPALVGGTVYSSLERIHAAVFAGFARDQNTGFFSSDVAEALTNSSSTMRSVWALLIEFRHAVFGVPVGTVGPADLQPVHEYLTDRYGGGLRLRSMPDQLDEVFRRLDSIERRLERLGG